MKLRTMIVTAILTLLPSAVFAQGGNNVMFNGISFNAPEVFGNSVNIMQVTGDPVDLEGPGGPDAKHIEFVFYAGDPSMPVPAYYDAKASMRVYQIGDLSGYTFIGDRVKELQKMLADRPSLDQYMIVTSENTGSMSLPYLPVFPAAQVIRAKAAYVETPTLKGIAYLTHYAQDVSPLINGSLMYTIQGVSNDGRYYVSATMNPTSTVLPDKIADDFNYDQFSATFIDYLSTTVASLNAAPDSAFTPSLSTLDEMVKSITFAP